MRWHDVTAGAARLWRRRAPAPIPRILHQTWKDEHVPERYRAFRESWRAHHPDWEIRLWTDAALRAFVAEHAPGFLATYDGYADPICRVDAARYLVLERFGGVYADLDVECLRPFDPLLAQGGLLIGQEPAAHAALRKAVKRGLTVIPCPTVIASVPGHPAWRLVRAALEENRGRSDPLDATGPFLLARVFARAGARTHGPAAVRITASDLFYPFDKAECWSGVAFDLAARLSRTRTSYAIHYWDGGWFRDAGAAGTAPAGPVRVRSLAPGEDASAPAPSAALDIAIPQGPLPLVSCLMVTHDRPALARQAIACFQAQTWPRRELVILDDGPGETLARHVAGLADPTIRHLRLPRDPEATLGDLRQRAVDAAAGAFVCQWDDDDLSDPLRIAAQMAALAVTGTAASFLERWAIWWPRDRRLAISHRRIWEGSMLCAKAALPPYLPLKRGEDTALVGALRATRAVALVDQPRLYLYVAHGRNTFTSEELDRQWPAAELQVGGADYGPTRAALATRLPIAAHEAALGLAPPTEAAVSGAAADKNAAGGLAAAAEAAGDWHEAARCWRDSWIAGRNVRAGVGLHRALLRSGRGVDAAAFLVRMARDPAVSPSLRLRIDARLLAAAGDWPAAAALLRDQKPLMASDSALRRIYARALLATGEATGAAAVLADAPGGGDAADFALVVRGLTLQGSTGGATAETVWGVISRARRSGFATMSPAAIACLTALLSSRSGARAAEALLDEIDALPPDGPPALANRIEAAFQRRRVASQTAIAAGTPPPGDAGDLALLDRIMPPQQTPAWAALLRESFTLLDGLAARHPDLRPDPLNRAGDARAVAARLCAAIDAGTPLSLVRLGDGEGALLPWRDDLEPWRAADLATVRRTWWGDVEPPAAAWAALASELAETIREADIVGISDGVHLARTLLDRQSEPGGVLDANARGRLGVLHQAAGVAPPPDGRPLFGPGQMLTSAHIHQALAWWELWQPVIGRTGTVDLVTCHPDLADAVVARFGVGVGTVHLVPPERRFAAQFAARFAAGPARHHYPETFEALRPAIAATPPGRVVLVAAGVLGKIYCGWAKRAGAIAIDVGAAADHWLGHHTRTLSAVGDFALDAGLGPHWSGLATGTSAAAAVAEPPLVLVLTPMKNAARHWPRYRALLERLDYPAERLSLGILEGDSDDGTYDRVAADLPALGPRFRSVKLFKHDHGLHLDGPRWAPKDQARRRGVLARARNRLLSLALADEARVLWLDADLVDYPPDLLRRLLATGKPIVVPHCISARDGRTFDLNTFKLSADAASIDWSAHIHDGLLQPPAGLGRLYLDAFAGRPLVPVDAVGGTALLIDAELHRDGLIFPVAPYRRYIETEGLAMMAADMGATCWGVPDLTIVHAPE